MRTALAFAVAAWLSAIPRSPLAQTDPKQCGALRKRIQDGERLALQGDRAASCGELRASIKALERLAVECRSYEAYAADAAITVAVQLRAQRCVRAPSATPNAGPREDFNSPQVIAAAKEHVDRLRRVTNESRQACGSTKSCPAADRAEDLLIRSTVAYLAIVTPREGGSAEAKRLLLNTLPVDATELVKLASRLRPGGLNDAALLSELFDAIEANASSSLALRVEAERLTARLRTGAAPGTSDAAVVEALVKRGLKPDEATRIVVQLGESFRDKSPEEVRRTFELAAYVRDPEIIRAWRASLDWLFGKGALAPTDLVTELNKTTPSPTALLDIVSRMHEEQAKALVSYGSVLAHVEDQIRIEQHEQRTPRNAVIVFAPKRPSEGCGETEAFQLGLEDVLSRISPDGIRMPFEIDADEKTFETYLDAAVCRCRGGRLCGAGPAVAGSCEGVVGIRIEKQSGGETARARGTVRFAAGGEGNARRFEGGDVLSPAFPVGCTPPARAQQAQAALEFLQAIAQQPVLFRLFPTDAPAAAPQPEPSRWSSLLLSGLPYLRDSRRDNDRIGWSLAGGDVALTSCALVAGTLSVKWRNDYSNGDRQALSSSNAALATAGACLGAVVIGRVLSGGLY